MGRVKNLQSLESEGKCMETPTKCYITIEKSDNLLINLESYKYNIKQYGISKSNKFGRQCS